ncbi:hypothetical protein CAI21_09835 [Alkalilimnicola ehrlichii]|uniref:Helicase HerA central domain-containing protein n=1 Tax=Alkalilimnicola ehrlichii TaxID=351052 RepID=A0A3E0WV58_9GAMM|nr:DUF87 domain-containing protein [Alkalilimnicola ehrlichii]RFA29358.1 hypothetical protein CAI21_09835 [Alkalilimnicola ehrlichii]RFA36872.1 hypothetical protein CAL65_10170 [Alkalilimnicola ehrlichii]
MSLANQPLLVFQGEGQAPHAGLWASATPTATGVRPLEGALTQTVELAFEDACRNVIVFGLTGMGKSTGIMKPALERLIEKGCSGLVLDCKEDYAALVKRYPKRVTLVGASRLSRPINLLAGMTAAAFQALIEQLRPKNEKDPYWGSMAVQDATLVFEYHWLRYRQAPTLDLIYQALFQPSRFCRELDRWVASREKIPHSFALRLDAVRQNAFPSLPPAPRNWHD